MDLIEQEKIGSPEFKRHPWELARFKILLFLMRLSPAKNYIADIGSGDGYVTTQLTKKLPYSRIAAVDIHYTDEFIRNNQNNRQIFVKQLTDIPEGQHIDTVLLMDVIEHVETPDRFLQSILAVPGISPSTCFIITVPAFQFLFTPHDVQLKHFRRYNRNQLIALLEAQRFTIKHSGYFFTGLFILRAFQKLLHLSHRQGVHNWSGGRLLTSALTLVLWIDFKICWYLSRLGINLPGLSCYCICHPLPS